MKFNSNWFKEMIMEYSMKGVELKSKGRDMNDPELARIIDVLIWAGQAYRCTRPPENEEIKKQQLADYKIAVTELNKLGAFEKYIEK